MTRAVDLGDLGRWSAAARAAADVRQAWNCCRNARALLAMPSPLRFLRLPEEHCEPRCGVSGVGLLPDAAALVDGQVSSTLLSPG
jgi:hypothetical protein